MKLATPQFEAPQDATARRDIPPVVCYPPDALAPPDLGKLSGIRQTAVPCDEMTISPRDAACIDVPAGCFFRIVSVEGAQVGDLNLWSKTDLTERFYSGKTRALHGTHLSTGDRMWSSFPNLRPMATITADTLDWYGFDDFGGSVHDVIGTRCDPYTGRLLSGKDYHNCCHSNLTRALAKHCDLPLQIAETHVHDVLNVFMCTGFTRDTGQYFMKASPVRPGDYLEFHAEIDLIVGLSACPGGDCSHEHSSDAAACFPLLVQVFDPGDKARALHEPALVSLYDRSHGTD
ncbi:urea carboxylase-associated family protein [Yoonia sp.]|uniref:urea carboxylase-associated family protein n=1 Tax=Yoonia sp. TaxID=2212373 RepID=UPI003974EFD3